MATYRQYLQSVYDTSAAGTAAKEQAAALLNVVGDDGKIDANYIANPDAYAAQSGKDMLRYYDAPGITGVNDNFKRAYLAGNEYSPYGTTSTGSSAGSVANERAAYDDQINSLNQLLSYTQTSKDQGLASLQAGMDDEARKLADQRTKAMAGYDEQSVQNSKDKLAGTEQVDDFANTSYKSLQRLLQGGNAGVSSVGRQLVPQLVSKSAGAKRQGVFDTAGANEQSIAKARGSAEDEYTQSAQDLENQRKSKTQSFLESILQKQNDLETQKRDLEVKKAMANGSGYAAARAAGDASQANINSRMNELAQLFGTYKPTYTARAMNLQTPELSKYTVDKTAQINSDNSLPTSSSYYLTQLKKKQQAESY